MNFRDLKGASVQERAFIYKQYELTFPVDERRNEAQFHQLFENEHTRILSIDSNDKSMGYFVTWPFEDFLFVEFFEIYAIFRNTGLGARALQALRNTYHVIVLETEPPELGTVARKRIAFYENSGFKVVDEQYRQPAYDQTKNSIHMYLMATGIVDLTVAKTEIYRRVYGVVM